MLVSPLRARSQRPWVRLTLVLLWAVLGTACHDAPTLPTPAASAGTVVARVSHGQHQRVPFYCTLGRYSPTARTGWETRADTLYFPPGELDAAGRTVRYEYRVSFTGGRPLASASCLVPYTEGALRRVDRRFGVTDNGGAEQYRARQGMVTIQGCVKDENTGCELDPLVITAPPKDTPTDPCDVDPLGCLTKRSGGADDWWYDGTGSWGGGSGDTGGASTEYQEPELEDTRPDCDKEPDGYCKIREIREDEWELFGSVIESIREDVHECREAKAILQSYYAQGRVRGRFRFWDGKDLNAARTRQRFAFMSSDAGGRVINLDGYFALRDKGVVVHEALHVYLNNINSPLRGTDNEDWVFQWEEKCEA